MNIKGLCYFSHIHNKHMIVILSESDKDGRFLLVPLSSIQFKENGKYQYQNQSCSFYDNSCTINSDEIIADNGISVLNRPTYALYKFVGIISKQNLKQETLNGNLEYRCVLNNDLLNRLQIGATKSDFLEENLKNTFIYFKYST